MELTECLNILLSVVAIGIAIWSSRSTSRAANKQIREIVRLSAVQIELSMVELEMDRIKTGLKEVEKRNELKKLENGDANNPEVKAKIEELEKEIQSLHDWGLRVFKVESELKFLQDNILKKGS